MKATFVFMVCFFVMGNVPLFATSTYSQIDTLENESSPIVTQASLNESHVDNADSVSFAKKEKSIRRIVRIAIVIVATALVVVGCLPSQSSLATSLCIGIGGGLYAGVLMDISGITYPPKKGKITDGQ